MEFDFLVPIDNEIIDYKNHLSSQYIGGVMALHTDDAFPDLSEVKIALVGVLENRGDEGVATVVDLTSVRKSLYGLFMGN